MQTVSTNLNESKLRFSNPNEKKIAIGLHEVFSKYLRLTHRPLTRLEQRAFRYLLDTDPIPTPECECNYEKIAPEIVQALDPDPVEAIVPKRNLEGQSCPSQRYHTEKIRRNQGITLLPKTRREPTTNLQSSARRLLNGIEAVMHELLRLPCLDHESNDGNSLGVALQSLLKLVNSSSRDTRASRTARTSRLPGRGLHPDELLQPTVLPTAHTPGLVCPRYDIIHEYVQIVARPLTGLEQRAFLYMLDVEAGKRHAHPDTPGICKCINIFPETVQALAPDSVQADVAKGIREGQCHRNWRFYTEKIGRSQGIVLAPNTQREHTADLINLARRLLDDFETVVDELLHRHVPTGDVLTARLQKLLELSEPIMNQKKPRRRK